MAVAQENPTELSLPMDPKVVLALEGEGWRIKQEFLDDLEWSSGDVSALRAVLLASDLKKAGKANIPDDVSRTAAATLAGPFVLQVMEGRDITRSLQASSTTLQTDKGMMGLTLTDGRITCKAVEYKPTSCLNKACVPGTKVCLRNVAVKSGILCLEPRSVEVLGGRVEALADAYEAQKKYAGVERSKVAGEGVDRAPPFRHFIPGRDDVKGVPRGGRTSQVGRSDGFRPDSIGQAAPVTSGGGRGLSAPTPTPNVTSTRTVEVEAVPAQSVTAVRQSQEAAKQKLMQQLISREEQQPSRGRGRQGFRRRGGRHREDEDEGGVGSMTLEEYEQQQKMKLTGPRPTTTQSFSMTSTTPSAQVLSDEALARQLQQQLDMEDLGPVRPVQGGRGTGGPSSSVAHDLRASLFTYGHTREEEEEEHRGRGRRGRSGGRGGRRGGRGRW